jgi:DnaJ-class molecular chaperone
VPTACTSCGGTGKVPVQDGNGGVGDDSMPLATLQGGAAGYVVREKMCGECDGDGVVVSAPVDPPQVESPACYVCQAPYGTPCTCGSGDQVYR